MRFEIAFKVLSAGELSTLEREGRFGGTALDVSDGFIHLSTQAQLDRTLLKHFSDSERLYIAAIDLEGLADRVRWEPSNSGQLYPHLYAAITIDAVVAYGPLERNDDGSLRLPVAYNGAELQRC